MKVQQAPSPCAYGRYPRYLGLLDESAFWRVAKSKDEISKRFAYPGVVNIFMYVASKNPEESTSITP